MKIEYTLTEEDILEYQLYTTSLSKPIHQKRLIARFGVPIMYILISIFFFFYNNNKDAILICVFLAALWLLFYPLYSKWKYKHSYLKHIKKNYKDKLDHVDALKLGNNTYFYVKEQGKEGKVKTSDAEKLIELKNHFFLQMKKGGAIIIPKTYVLNTEAFKQKMIEVNVEYLNETDWRWN